MTLPLIYMDIVFFAVLVATFLATGVFIGRKMARSKTTEFRKLLNIMARADHILDNYIISIQGNAKVLGEDLPVDGQRWKTSRDAINQAADQMKRHVERLRLIRRGLDPARTRVAPVNLARLIDQILVTLAQAATDRNIILGRVEVDGPNRPVTADPLMLEEIFTTLLDNAVKHSPPGTEVVAELTRRNGMALVRISDNGKGIKEELLRKIVNEGEKDNGAGAAAGSGMGLYIAKTLTEIHGGNFSVEAEWGKGATFSVELPFENYQAHDLGGGHVQRAMRYVRLLLKRVPSLPAIR